MIMNRSSLPTGCVVLNYGNAKKIKLPNADTIPTLSNLDDLPVFQDDKEPYFKIEAINFPVEGTGGIYTKKFWQSFINKLKTRVYPGSKRGHEFQSRPNTDFYTVGGMIEENADGESGTVFLKMYIPKSLDSDNYGFINDSKAGIVHFSIVTLPKYVMKKDKDGVEKTYFVSSEGYERNDAVEYGAGAMDQIVNEKQNIDFEKLKKLINSNLYDAKNKKDGDIIQEGVVYRSVLRRLVSNADENKQEYAELISLIDTKENERRKTVDKKELFELLSNLYKNGQTNAAEIAEAVGFADKVRSESDVKNAEVVKELVKNYGDEYQKAIEDIKKENEINAELAVINAVVNAGIPAKIKNADGTDEENPAYMRAFEICKSKKGEELTEAVKNLGDDKILKAIRQNQASVDDGVTAIKSTIVSSELKEY